MPAESPAGTIAAQYLTDASGFTGLAERLIVPATEAEVVETLREAVKSATPVTIAGAGSGLTGSRVPQGGWVISMERFRKLEIEPGFARVGPAVSLLELRDASARTGQFYAPDPTEITASIGGTIATNASGSRSFKYGSTRRHLRALRVALMDGTVHEYRRGEKIDFERDFGFSAPRLPVPATTKYTAGYKLEARHGLDRSLLRLGGHARRHTRGRSHSAATAERSLLRRHLLRLRQRRPRRRRRMARPSASSA